VFDGFLKWINVWTESGNVFKYAVLWCEFECMLMQYIKRSKDKRIQAHAKTLINNTKIAFKFVGIL